MLLLSNILKPSGVDLALEMEDLEQGIECLARRLEGDPGMSNWAGFHAALKLSGKPVGSQSLLSHTRTDHVSTMLMAAGRLPAGKSSPDDVPGASEDGVHFIFLIAVPMTLAAEYLRMVGALARGLRNPDVVAQLRETGSPEEFVRILCAEAEAL